MSSSDKKLPTSTETAAGSSPADARGTKRPFSVCSSSSSSSSSILSTSSAPSSSSSAVSPNMDLGFALLRECMTDMEKNGLSIEEIIRVLQLGNTMMTCMFTYQLRQEKQLQSNHSTPPLSCNHSHPLDDSTSTMIICGNNINNNHKNNIGICQCCRDKKNFW